jgi:hypothetical protein
MTEQRADDTCRPVGVEVGECKVTPHHEVIGDSGGIAPCVKLVTEVNVSFTPLSP